MRKTNLSPALFFTMSVLLFALCGILLFALPQRTYSENENRYLTVFEPPTVSGFFDTSFQQNLTDGANDQFVGRDLWMMSATAFQQAAGFQDMGGVYLGKDGYYFERILDSGLSETRFLNNLRFLEEFAKTYGIPTTFLPVPSKSTVLKEQHPANAVFYDAAKLYGKAGRQLQQAAFLDIRPALLDARHASQLYFKTDHHWTMNAAYLAYTVWCSAHGEEAVSLAQFAPACVREDFFGTLYSKAPVFHAKPDRLFLPLNLPAARIAIGEKTTDSIYDWDKLETKDKYGVYFGGNFGRVDIQAKSNASGKTLLTVKDSFANSLMPFLMEHYSHIMMVDFRYYNQPLSELIRKTAPDEVLVLYELSNFAQDANFFKILK